MKRPIALYVQISTLFLVLLLVVATTIGGYGYYASRNMLASFTTDLMDAINREITGNIDHTLESASMATNLLSRSSLPFDEFNLQRMERLPLMQEALKSSSTLVSVYIGYDSGDMFMLRHMRSESDIALFNAPKGTRYILQTIERSVLPPSAHYIYLDAMLNTLREENRPDFLRDFDPRKRPWYTDALEKGDPVTSAPYVFFTTKKVGLTMSVPAENTAAVVGADIQLETLGELLKNQKITAGTQIALISQDGTIVAHEDIAKLVSNPQGGFGGPKMIDVSESGIPLVKSLSATIKGLKPGEHYASVLEIADDSWHVSISPVRILGTTPFHLVMAIPESELMAEAFRQRKLSIWITLAIILVAIPLTVWVSRKVSNPIRDLATEADSIRRFDFSQTLRIRSSILEVDRLAQTMGDMKQTIRRFLAISEAVASEENFDRLLPMLLSETIGAASAQAGVLYLVDVDTLNPVSALLHDGLEIPAALKTISVDSGESVIRRAVQDNAPRTGVMEAAEAAVLGLDSLPDAAALKHVVAVPLLNRARELVGCIFLLRDTPFDSAQVSFIKALSGSAASSLETRELIKSQKELFEAFIKLIAGAIDSKSPYTGGHCERVPELTKMLARAACDQQAGPYKDFSLDDRDWEAVHVAAWLHDCGKITTPEHVVDKSTKLETIYDRIHEIRMRFEVLKRDAEIACLRAIAAGEDAIAAHASLAVELVQLDDDFKFVGACNEGGEFMAPEKVERLRAISARTWTRTLDDRIGISSEEFARKSVIPVAPLPASEAVLSDKPEHLFERLPRNRVPEDNPWGFRMPVPELLYNRGELHNLSIARGTLTDEDRYKINEHIVQTVIMLSNLPFPKHMRQVPEIAGGHHEKMDGTGSPKRLERDQMSPVARMMAIADVFEALTAVDRPYKKGKTLSEAVRIMSFMKKDRHIDPDLFDLFLRSGVYLDYARRFMRPEQIDAVDIENFVTSPGVTA